MTITVERISKGGYEVTLEAEKFGGYIVSMYEDRGGIWYTAKESKAYADRAKAEATFRRYARGI